MTLRPSRFVTSATLAACIALGLVGCSSSKHVNTAGTERSLPHEKAKKSDKPDKPEPPVPPGSVARSRVDAVLKEGPPWLLSRVQMEEVLRQNKFLGWRVTQFPSDWDSSGIRPGDVVTRVNGVSIERPDDLWDAWVAVSDAKEIRVAYERDGKASEAVVPIVGDVDPKVKKTLEEGTPPPPATAKKDKLSLRKSTVIISEEANQPDE